MIAINLEAGRYELPRLKFYERIIPEPWRRRLPKIEIALIDSRERDLTIKGQEILTADKVAIRVSIIVQFKVHDPRAALHEVESYSERIYGDVQLAARRSLASMTFEEILTNRNKLSEDISADVKETARSYGVTIMRADVKDLIFPGNLQEIMNRVLAAERMSQVQLVEARTKAETQRLDAQSRLEMEKLQAEVEAAKKKMSAESEAEAQRIQTEADILSLRQRAQAAQAYTRIRLCCVCVSSIPFVS